MHLNVIHLIGRLGKDPELRQSEGGTPWCTASLAVDSGSNGPTWFDVKAFGQPAEFLGTYGRKGRLTYIGGRMVTETFTGKDGQERTVWRVIADTVRFLDSPPEAAE